MKKKGTTKGMMVVGSLRRDGLTTYTKQGRLIVRSAESIPNSLTLYAEFLINRNTSADPNEMCRSFLTFANKLE